MLRIETSIAEILTRNRKQQDEDYYNENVQHPVTLIQEQVERQERKKQDKAAQEENSSDISKPEDTIGKNSTIITSLDDST
jgi:hypothetical protein